MFSALDLWHYERVPIKAATAKPKAPRKRTTTTPLAKGQYWKLKNGHVQIVELGKLLASYKVLRVVGQKGVQTQMSGIGDLEKYLRASKADLMTSAPTAGT